MKSMLAWLYWDPSKIAFTIPVLERPVAWYGILFVLGFILGYFIIIPVISRFLQKTKHDPSIDSYFIADRLCWFVVLGTIIGARLGHIFFYEWDFYYSNPLSIIEIWKGGLASHGGVLGILAGIYFFIKVVHKKVPDLTFIKTLDFLAVPSALAACFIRLGNFVNQEILGTFTTLPWAVVFGTAADGTAPLPRHPVQLYEAGAYFITFVVLYTLWKKKGEELPDGTLIGLLFIFAFGSRFILEFWKDNLDSILNISYLQMGQLLSLPLIILGFIFISWKKWTRCT